MREKLSNLVKDVQLYIHRYYETIKLLLMLFIAALGIFFFVSRYATAERILHGVKAETDKQTVLINAQFKALCLIVTQTSGIEALSELDPPLEERCRNLTAEAPDEDEASTSAAVPVDEADQAAPTDTSSSPATRDTATVTGRTNQPTTSEPPEQTDVEERGLLDVVVEMVLQWNKRREVR